MELSHFEALFFQGCDDLVHHLPSRVEGGVHAEGSVVHRRERAQRLCGHLTSQQRELQLHAAADVEAARASGGIRTTQKPPGTMGPRLGTVVDVAGHGGVAWVKWQDAQRTPVGDEFHVVYG